MAQKDETGATPSRYMTFGDVARELGISVDTVRAKALVKREFAAVDISNGSERGNWRVIRASFDSYCERIEAEAARRFAA